MNIEQLKNIREVSKEKSISKASSKLHLTQAAVSKSISNFESEVGFKIFNRSRNGCDLTAKGEKIIQLIHQSLNSLEEIDHLSNILSNTINLEKLSLAAIPSLFLNIFPKLLLALKESYPLAEIRIEEDGGKEILSQVINDQLDIGFVIVDDEMKNIIDEYNLKCKVFMTSRMVVFTNKSNAIADEKSLYINDLADYPMVFYKGYNWGRYINEIKSNLKEFNLLFTTNNSEVIKKFVSNNNAISILSEFMIQDYCTDDDSVTYVPLSDYKPEQIEFAYIHKQSNAVTQNITPLIDEII